MLPPYSETFGRKKLYVVSTVLYAVSSVVIAAVPSLVAVAIGRFVTGLISSVPTSVAAGSIEDLFPSEERVWVLFAWILCANIGLVLGPVFGTYVSFSIGWSVASDEHGSCKHMY